jgi:hypothetical protein
MSRTILTNAEVAKAIYVDSDYDPDELSRLAELATSYIFHKTGYNFAQDEQIEPLAKECAILYVRQSHLGEGGYNKDYDYSHGITSLIFDLQIIAQQKLAGGD